MEQAQGLKPAFLTTLLILVFVSRSHPLIVDPDGIYNFDWELSEDRETITFELTVGTVGFVGLGVSPNGTMDGADIFAVEIRENGLSGELRDCYAVGHRPSQDDESNLSLLSFSQNETTTYAKFSRMLDTGDSTHDQPIHEGETVFIWAYGASVTPNLTYHGGARGSFGLDVFNKKFQVAK